MSKLSDFILFICLFCLTLSSGSMSARMMNGHGEHWKSSGKTFVVFIYSL